MRRNTTALTKTIAGAALVASAAIVIPAWAQQNVQPATTGRAPTPSSAVREPVPASTTPGAASAPAATVLDPKTQDATVYGVGVSREPRYLIRNGLDFIEYQEYERALKYLREAEARQKELTAAEKNLLKKGIETAQRGLREAVGAKTPYAVSKRPSRAGGFTIARNSKASRARTIATETAIAAGRNIGIESDQEFEPKGDPIRLTSATSAANKDASVIRTDHSPSPIQNTGLSDPAIEVTAAAAIALASERAAEPNSAPAQLPDLEKFTASSETPSFSQEPPSASKREDTSIVPITAQTGADLSTPLPTLDQEVSPTTQQIAVDSPRDLASALPKPVAKDEIPPSVTAPDISGTRASATRETPSEPSLEPELATEPEPKVGGELVAQDVVVAEPVSSPAPINLETVADPSMVPNSVTPAAANPPVSAEVTSAAQPTVTTKPDPTPADGKLVPEAPSNLEPAVTKIDDAKTDEEATPVASTEEEIELPPLPPDMSSNPSVPSEKTSSLTETPVNRVPASEPAMPATLQEAQAPAMIPGNNAEPKVEALPETATETSLPVSVPPGDEVSDVLPGPLPSLGTEPSTPAAPISLPEAGLMESADDRLPPLPPEVAAVPVKPAEIDAQKAEVPAVDPTQSPAPVTPVAAAPTQNAAPVPVGASVEEGSRAAASDEPPAEPAEEVKTSVGSINASTAPRSVEEEPVPSEVMPLSSGGGVVSGLSIPRRANPSSGLSDELQREVEEIAQRQEEVSRRRQVETRPPGGRGRSGGAGVAAPGLGASPYRDGSNDYGTQSQVDISRAPSPAEARPIHAIPVPEDYVPLAPRDWSPQRKYWSAAGTCHMPLYFQDAALERYGHSVEQFLGPAGRFFSYPLDDPTQSTQRNQMLQPVFSIGLFAFQIAAWPYNLIVDPPWEAEYDLGYYRPGDQIPTDVYYLPLHGVGPPLKGKSY